MKKAISLLLVVLILFNSFSVSAQCRPKPIIVGYRYITKVKKVKVTKKKYLGKFTITYYCPCAYCCGKSDGVTSTGRKAKVKRTVAVNPNVIPYGTKLKIGKTKGYVAEDTGGMGYNHIDIFVSSHAEALRKGVKYKKVWAYKTVTKKKKYRLKIPIYRRTSNEY